MKLKIKNISDNQTINIALDTINIGKQALVFANTKRSAEKTAEDISKILNSKIFKNLKNQCNSQNKIKTQGIKEIKETEGTKKINETTGTKETQLEELSNQIIHSLTRPTKQCERLSDCIKKGIAFHHAGLTAKQKELIEDNFRNGLIRVICSTPTLAVGVDLPAFRTILKDLRRYGPRGLAYIPVLEYLQMAGRAGRPNFDKEGQSIIIAPTENERAKLEQIYINGKPEDIYSKLAVEPVLRTYILSLIASNFVNTKKEIFNFFSKTFWAFQFADTFELQKIVEKMLDLLEGWEFIINSESENIDDFTSADQLDKKNQERYMATPLGKRIAELYIDPLTAHNFIECIKTATSKNILPFSFLQMISHSLELRPLLRVKVKEQDIIQEELVKYDQYLLEQEPSIYESEYPDFLNSIKTAMFFQDWIEEKDEEFLLEKYDIRPGEISAKLNVADWLLYTSGELTRILKFQPMLKELLKLRIRVKNGVKEELITLLKLEKIGRVRARKLYYNKIRTIGDVREADIQKLVQILGKSIAINIKKQVGQDYDKMKVKERKRKGQISLNDF